MIRFDKKKLEDITEWFFLYVDSFKNDDTELLLNIDLKIKHSLKVREEIINIAKDLKLTEDETNLAEVIALLHDIGRFKQYKDFRTFVDRKSVNHAELGLNILDNMAVLHEVDDKQKDIIKKSILYHNRISIPKDESDECLLFIKLIRDADKLDIYRVVTEYYATKEKNGVNKGIELDLPDLPCVSSEVCIQLAGGMLVDLNNVKYLNDFKLLQLGWIFDINFNVTYRIIRDNKYLEKINETITSTEESKTAVEYVMKYVKEKLKIPVIDFTKCIRCKKCIDACPNDAISMSFNNCCAKCIKYCLTMDVPCHPKEIIFKYEKCNSCGLCLSICPKDAIYWHETTCNNIDDN